MDVISEFFTSIPDAVRALWQFGNGWAGAAITLGSIVLTGAFAAGAMVTRERMGWVSAVLGSMAAMIAAFWAFGILPSAWIYYIDGAQDVLIDQVIPSRVAFMAGENEIVLFGNFYQVFRDSIVMVETMVAMGGFGALALYIQKRYPMALAEGEEAREQSGGYK